MKFDKVLSIVVVLVMVSTSLFVIQGDEVFRSEASGNAATEISMTDLIDATANTYWVNATYDSGNDIITITKGTGSACVVNSKDDSTYNESTIKITGTDFEVPVNCGFKSDNNTLKTDSELVVKGDFCFDTITKDTTPFNLTVSKGGDIYANELEYVSELTITGGYMCVNSDCDLEAAEITVEGGEIEFNNSLNFSDESTITVENGQLSIGNELGTEGPITINVSGGSFYVAYDMAMGGNFTINVSGGSFDVEDDFYVSDAESAEINISGGYFYVDYGIYFNESDMDVSLTITGGTVAELGLECDNGSADMELYMYDVTAYTQSNDGFSAVWNHNTGQMKLSGSLLGVRGNSYISFYSDDDAKTVFDNFALYSLRMDMDSYYGKIILNNDFMNIDTDSYITSNHDFTGTSIVAASGEAKFASTFYSNGGYYVNVYTCNTSIITKSTTSIQVLATSGISKINTGSAYGDYILVEADKTVNLNSISVECRNGYAFDGWYYKDYNGNEHKVSDPSKCSVYEGIVLYATAVPVAYDYSMHFMIMEVLIILALIAAVVYVLYKEGIIGRKS